MFRLFFFFKFFLILTLGSCASPRPIDSKDLVRVYESEKQNIKIKTFHNAFLAYHGKEPLGLQLNLSYIENKSPNFFMELQFYTDKLSPRISKGDQLTLTLDKKEQLSLFCVDSKSSFQENLKHTATHNSTHPTQKTHTPSSRGPSHFSGIGFSSRVGVLASFSVTQEQIDKILQAESLSLQFNDQLSQTPLTGTLKEKNLDILKEFKNQLKKKELI
ncbi:MAG: hypothetical protein L7U87_02190 [Chlamydiales bacterium]|nr:hypothetical protein [Chlamydiales bacterium]